LKDLLERGDQGDPAALPAIRKAFDERPELVALLGDLARHAEESLLTLVAGDALTAREAAQRHHADLRQRLMSSARTELETLLVRRVVLCWLAVHEADLALSACLTRRGEASPSTRAATQRLGRAEARLLAGVKALATVQKLTRPAPSPLQMLFAVPRPAGRGAEARRPRATARETSHAWN
jgi:hypothetical protein